MALGLRKDDDDHVRNFLENKLNETSMKTSFCSNIVLLVDTQLSIVLVEKCFLIK